MRYEMIQRTNEWAARDAPATYYYATYTIVMLLHRRKAEEKIQGRKSIENARMYAIMEQCQTGSFGNHRNRKSESGLDKAYLSFYEIPNSIQSRSLCSLMDYFIIHIIYVLCSFTQCPFNIYVLKQPPPVLV
jgi:hypothetical protein